MIAIVGMIVQTRIIDTMDVRIHRKRVVNGNVLIATNMSASLSLEQHIVGRKWVVQNEQQCEYSNSTGFNDEN